MIFATILKPTTDFEVLREPSAFSYPGMQRPIYEVTAERVTLLGHAGVRSGWLVFSIPFNSQYVGQVI